MREREREGERGEREGGRGEGEGWRRGKVGGWAIERGGEGGGGGGGESEGVCMSERVCV